MHRMRWVPALVWRLMLMGALLIMVTGHAWAKQEDTQDKSSEKLATAEQQGHQPLHLLPRFLLETCGQWSGPDAIALPGTPLVSVEPAPLNGQSGNLQPAAPRQSGYRYRWSDGDDDISLEVMYRPVRNGRAEGGASQSTLADSSPSMFRLTVGSKQPRLLLIVAADCTLRAARKLEYANTGAPHTLFELDVELQILSEQPLNPPVPSIGDLPAASGSASGATSSPRLRIAMIDSGVNYLLPDIASRLARDDEGRLIGYDYWDDDARPFDAHPARSPFFIQRHGTRTASLLLREAPDVDLVPYRYPRPDMSRMAALVQHAAENNVAIVGMPLGGNKSEEWQVFADAARQHPDILFVVSAGNNGRDIDEQALYPARLNIDNMLVVTSADDSARPAQGSNWGRESVDYLLPAEFVEAVDYDGEVRLVSGSSYAVSRLVAMLARLKQRQPEWQAAELIKELRRRYADGASARYVKGGYIADPLYLDVSDAELQIHESVELQGEAPEPYGEEPVLMLAPTFLVLRDYWAKPQIEAIQQRLQQTLAQCGVGVKRATTHWLDVADYLRDMTVGQARSWRSAIKPMVAPQSVRIFLLRQTRMLHEAGGQTYQYDAEAFGRANTRGRDWLRDSVWVREGVRDADLAVVHELVHVLMNSGSHSDAVGNLMNAQTSPANTALNVEQCAVLRRNGLQNNLLSPL